MTDVMFDGVYRDDGILVFNKKVTVEEIVSWRNNFQASVNRLPLNTFNSPWRSGILTLQLALFHPIPTSLLFVLMNSSPTMTWNFTRVTMLSNLKSILSLTKS
jgi:hypothetical protein